MTPEGKFTDAQDFSSEWMLDQHPPTTPGRVRHPLSFGVQLLE